MTSSARPRCVIVGSWRPGGRSRQRYGYAEMAVPVFEFTDVFSRILGETSDIVSKEMYNFDDRAASVTLRPEFTAGFARALILARWQRFPMGRAHGRCSVRAAAEGPAAASSTRSTPSCWARRSPRRRRAARGRPRILEALGLARQVTLELNTLGDPAEPERLSRALVAYLAGLRGSVVRG